MRNPLLLGVLSLLGACTGTIGTDVGDDQPPPPPSTDVQMLVRDGATPQANVRVIFQNPDDSMIAEAVTGADGVAMAEMPNGGNLTVIRTFAPLIPGEPIPSEVYTYVGVKAGDRLELGKPTSETTPPNAINVMVPADATGTVKIVTPCGSGQGTGPIIALTTRGCGAMVDFYVTDGNQSSFSKRAAYSENVDLSTEALLGALSATVSATNVPPDTTVNVELQILSGTFELFSSGAKRVDTAPANVNLPALTNVDQLTITSLSGAAGKQMFAKREVYSASPAIVNAGALLPYVTTPEYAPTGITWTEAGPGVADAVITRLNVTRPTGLEPEYVRTIIAAHGVSSLRIPALPGADVIYNPTADDQIAGAHGLLKVPGGYDAIRARAFAVTDLLTLAPTDGTVVLSYAGATPP